MTRINAPDIASRIARRLGITGPTPVDQVFPELVPVMLVSDLTQQEEHAERSTRLCVGYGQINGVAGQYSHVQLKNPSNSGVDIIAELALVSRGTNGSISLATYDTDCTTSVTQKGFRDRRISGTPVGQIREETNVGSLGSDVARVQVATALQLESLPLDMILAPGDGIVIRAQTVQVQVTACFYWTERIRARD